jgi:hypothetical protein
MTEYSDSAFVSYVSNLHAEKHAVYGDSWKRRGEQVAILANIARKVDRLGVAGAGDTSADTAVDLLVYLLKYRLWLDGGDDGPAGVDHVLSSLPNMKYPAGSRALDELISYVQDVFEQLLIRVDANQDRRFLVDGLIRVTNELARHLWAAELTNDHLS